VTIDVLPDDVLVQIFFYVTITRYWDSMQNRWHVLVHVCRRWRYVVSASPRRLNLRLEYRGHGPMLEVLDVWPVLPITLISRVGIPPSHPKSDRRWDNMVAALESEHHDRICEIDISDMTNSRWGRFTAAMQKPFPELTYLYVFVRGGGDLVPVLPDSFLGGSAPHLQELWLRSIPFPSMQKLLLSANRLVTLSLKDIPDSGCISPDAMATALTVMATLETLHLQFRSPRSRPDPASRPLPPSTRFVLPALTKLSFKGVHEYLEDLLARIDAPLLYYLHIVFFMDLNFGVPQLHRLIGHAEEFKAFDHAEMLISDRAIQLSLYPKTGVVDHYRLLELQINCRELEWQLSSLAQVCSSSFALIPTLEELKIKEYDYPPSSHWKDDLENAQWLELLDPLTALKDLYLTHEIAQRVCSALQGLSGEPANEVLPALRNLFIQGFWSLGLVQEALVPFVTARQLSGHPMVLDRWKDPGRLT